MGSNGQFDFEDAIAEKLNRKCKVSGLLRWTQASCPKARADLHVRLHRHVEPPWRQLLQLVGHGCHRGQSESLHRCIGDADEVRDGRVYKRASTILKELNIPRIDLLKMDIEVCRQRRTIAVTLWWNAARSHDQNTRTQGWEWRVIPGIIQDMKGNAPGQILFELHFNGQCTCVHVHARACVRVRVGTLGDGRA
jgi:hypothetical protein